MKAISIGLMVLSLSIALSHASSKPTAKEIRMDHVTAIRPTLEYGLRYDVDKWIDQDTSLEAIKVRTLLFNRENPPDMVRIQNEISVILKKQRKDGFIADPDDKSPVMSTCYAVFALLDLGAAPDRPEIKEAGKSMIEELKKSGVDGKPSPLAWDSGWGDVLAVMCRIGMSDNEVVVKGVKNFRDWIAFYDKENAFGMGLPRTPDGELEALAFCRKIEGVDETLTKTLHWIAERIEPTGCGVKLGLFPTLNVLSMIANIDNPELSNIVRTILPVIIRLQKPDGSWKESGPWGDKSFHVIKILKKYGYLDKLKKLPPLPPDWQVKRTIPFVCANGWRDMCCEGDRIWVRDDKNVLVAVSQKDGTVIKKLELPQDYDIRAIGIWDSMIHATVKGTPDRIIDFSMQDAHKVNERLLDFKVRPMEIGGIMQFQGKIIVSNWELGELIIIDKSETGEFTRFRCAAQRPFYFDNGSNDFWVVDAHSPVIIKTNAKGDLLDWGERPFGWADIAYDGSNLWAMDPENNRICLIEKK